MGKSWHASRAFLASQSGLCWCGVYCRTKAGRFKFDPATFTCCGHIDRLEVVVVMMDPSGLDVCLHPLAFGS
ncbi:MAG: hypothetical protein CMJ20_13805 [Phycisphaeraceae bacterium]|nr:hypothetical protein [Phycisphaeraceae bacterium]